MTQLGNEKYKSILESTIVPGYLSMIDQAEKYNNLIQYISSIMPPRLYRFRSCSSLNLDSFDKDRFWLSSGCEMNDDFEARLSFDSDKIRTWLKDSRAKDGGIKVIEQLLNNEISTEQVTNNNLMLNSFVTEIKSIPSNIILTKSREALNFIENDIDSGLNYVTEIVRKLTRFASLTETVSSDMMWEIYADNAEGFALSYDLKNNNTVKVPTLTNKHEAWLNFYPVLYSDKRLDCTDYAKYLYQAYVLQNVAMMNGIRLSVSFLEKVLPCPNVFTSTKIALVKSDDWKQEKEWRAFYSENYLYDINEKHVCAICKPSAVYLGRKIKDINKKIIIMISKEKKIPVYQMKLSNNSSDYSLSPVLISNGFI